MRACVCEEEEEEERRETHVRNFPLCEASWFNMFEMPSHHKQPSFPAELPALLLLSGR